MAVEHTVGALHDVEPIRDEFDDVLLVFDDLEADALEGDGPAVIRHDRDRGRQEGRPGGGGHPGGH